MKVAIVCQLSDLVLPPEQTSIGIWTHEVALRLAQDCDVTILARRGSGGPTELAGPWGKLVSVPTAPLRLWSGASRLWAQLMPADRPLVAGRIHAPEYTAGLLRRLRALRPDVVHVQNMPQVVGAIRRLLPNAAILLHMHCDWLAELAPGRVARSLAAVDTVIGCSRHVAQGAEARHPAPGRRFVIIPNGAPPKPSGGPAAKVPGRVIFVGRVSPEKGLHVLLEAWPLVVAAHPGARLEIVGPAAVTPRAFLVDLSADPAVRALDRFYPHGRARPGSYDDALRALVPQEIADMKRSLFGRRSPCGLASASLLVNPSLSESFGMSLVEALSVDTRWWPRRWEG